MRIVLKSKNEVNDINVEADVVNHQLFGMTLAQIKNVSVHEGNRVHPLGDFFDVTVEDAKGKGRLIVLEGDDLGKFKRIGEALEDGEVQVNGDCGMYCGYRMSGGRIVVEGNCDAFCGMDMTGGELVVKGNASDYLGAAYRGEPAGMKGGRITVHGNAGVEVGSRLTGGTIIIKGDTDLFTGIHMKKGLIVVEGTAGPRVGAQMTGGTIVLSKGELLPGFKEGGPTKDPEIEGEGFSGDFKTFTGDLVENGKGTVLLRA